MGIGPDLAGKAAGGRKLIAVVYADMVGYSRLIGLDDAGTLRRLRTLRRALIDPAIREYGGSVVQTGGDSLLIAFDSVDGAVRCAVKVQQQLPVYDGDQRPDRRIRFRVGINIGDVIQDGTDLHGDGVNIAARLQTECPPGGICVSRSVRDHAHGRLGLKFEALGELTVKNIARPLEAFVLRLDPEATHESAARVTTDAEKPRHSGRRVRFGTVLVGGLAALVACGAGSAVWWMLHGAMTPASGIAVAPAPVQDRRQSIIILPFENASGDAAQDVLADGLTRLLTDRITGGDGPVIPELTAAAYRGKVVDLAAIGRQHNVHFALTGNARRQDGRLIVSATLYETADGRAVWSGQLDRPDGPAGERSILQTIYENVWQASIDEEAARAMRKPPNSLDKRDLLNMALASRLQAPTKAHLQEQIALIERALALDPNNSGLLERQARLHAYFVLLGYSSEPAADIAIADDAANHMLQIEPNGVKSLRAKAIVLRAQGKWREAEAVLHRVIGLQPTEANRRWELGTVLMAEGRHQEALESFETAKQFAGGDDPVYAYDGFLAMAELAAGQLADATATARLSVSEYPPDSGRLGEVPWLALIASESLSGKDDAAHIDLKKFLATPRSFHSMAELEKWQPLAANPKLLDGLRRAGMPDR